MDQHVYLLEQTCEKFNNRIVGMLPTEGRTYTAINEAFSREPLPREYLDNLAVGKFPNTIIKLKVGVIIMCIRNISPSLKNGTRLRITALFNRSIKAIIITESGFKEKEEVLFPNKFINDEGNVEFSRIQLPIKTSYAMTINKSQCQT